MYLRLRPNSKAPDLPKGGQFDQASTDDWNEVKEWVEKGFNVGLRLGGRTVIDFDDGKEAAREFHRKLGSVICGTICLTRRGIHFYFSGENPGQKFDHGDIKSGSHSYVVIPPSTVDGFQYRWIRQGELHPLPNIFPKKEITRQEAINENDPVRRLIRARAWISKREPKEDGNGRGLQTIKTCRALFQMFGLTEQEVWALMLEYNDRCCIPPYTMNQLSHKISDSQKGL